MNRYIYCKRKLKDSSWQDCSMVDVKKEMQSSSKNIYLYCFIGSYSAIKRCYFVHQFEYSGFLGGM